MHYQTLLKYHKPILFFSAMAVMFLVIFGMTTCSPLFLDDYLYAFVYGAERSSRVDSFADIVQSMTVHYSAWGGRVTVHSLVQLFIWMDKIVFNLCNALVYILLTYVLYRFSGAKGYDFKLYALILIGMWFCIPMFGETVLWLSGSFNYLWNVTFNLLWLLQFKKQLDNPRAKGVAFQILFCIASALVGSISENVSFACLLAAILLMVQMKALKQAVAPWMWASALCNFVGWLFLVVAPGNYVRADSISSEPVTLWTLYDRFVSITMGLSGYCFIPLCVFILLFFLAIYQKVAPRTLCTSLIFLLAAMASQYSLIASNAFSTRTMMGTQFLIFAACATLYTHLQPIVLPPLRDAILCMAVLFTAFNMLSCLDEDLRTNIQSKNRDLYVMEQAALGETEVVVNRIYATSDKCVFNTTLLDLEDYADFWVNQYYAAYYGVDSVIATK